MNNKFDELAKGLAQSVTRRDALQKFALGFAGFALASLGLPRLAHAGPDSCKCASYPYGCEKLYPPDSPDFYDCLSFCSNACGKKPNKHSHCC
jgi:hypothetical protein